MNYLRNLQMAGVTAMMDVVTIAEFAAINYVKSALIGPVSNMAPPGMPRNLLAEGINAAGDIAKLIIFSSNQSVTANTG
jgi:hypothetical protein